MDYCIIKRLFDLVVSKCNRMTRRALKLSKDLLLVDSTTITVGNHIFLGHFITGSVQELNYMFTALPLTEMSLQVVETTSSRLIICK